MADAALTLGGMTSPSSPACRTAGCRRAAVRGDDLCAIHGQDVAAFVAWLHADDQPRGFERARSIWKANFIGDDFEPGYGLTVVPVDLLPDRD